MSLREAEDGVSLSAELRWSLLMRMRCSEKAARAVAGDSYSTAKWQVS